LGLDEIKQISKTLKRKQMKRLRAREKRPVGNKQSIVEAKKQLRRWVEKQRRSAKQLRPFHLPATTTVVLDTPFLVWANPSGGVIDSKAEASNSTAQFGVNYTEDIPTGDHTAFAWLAFFFLWQNDIDSAKAVSTQTNLFVKGQGDCFALSDLYVPFSTALSEFSWDASFRIMFWEHGSGTDVPFQASQRAHITDLRSAAENIPFFRSSRHMTNVSQQVPLSYTNLIVPPGQLIVFAVSLHVSSTLDDGGSPDGTSWCDSDFWGDLGFLACPFVELQVTALV
jgi:hypothetical protein